MADLEQMAALSTPFTTSNGVEYKLPPLNLLTRRKALAYVELAKDIQESDAPQSEQVERLFEGLADLLQTWLCRVRPDLTREQIEEDFDLADVPELMAIINGMERQVQSAVPPASSAPRRRPRQRA